MAAKRRLANNRGLATLEAIPILVIFVMLIAYALGMWGSIHTATLHSISARTYAFSTFRNRTHLFYFRDNNEELLVHRKDGVRYHMTSAEDSADPGDFFASTRPIAIGRVVQCDDCKESDHQQKVFSLQARNRKGAGVGVTPIWIMVGYGMCLDVNCGDE